MALPATADFNGTNGVQLTAWSSSWTLNVGDFDISANCLSPDAAGDCLAHWNADSFNSNQYAQAGVVQVSSVVAVGVAVRCHASAATGYGFATTFNETLLFKLVSGTWTQIGSAGAAISAGQSMRLEVEGTTLRPYRNGTLSNIGSQTDSSISSGSAGVYGYDDDANVRIDNWEGGNLSGGSAINVPVMIHQRRMQGMS